MRRYTLQLYSTTCEAGKPCYAIRGQVTEGGATNALEAGVQKTHHYEGALAALYSWRNGLASCVDCSVHLEIERPEPGSGWSAKLEPPKSEPAAKPQAPKRRNWLVPAGALLSCGGGVAVICAVVLGLDELAKCRGVIVSLAGTVCLLLGLLCSADRQGGSRG